MQFACPFRRVNARAFFAVVSKPYTDHSEHVTWVSYPPGPRKRQS